ncbi:MAG: ATP-binding cassette domain-containing protein [Betaproteobacteria bacterium]|nr:ATP-binding cassette domain-containing protein [Betaproteobacteria bacterium]
MVFPLRAQGRLDAAARERVAALIELAGLKGFERYYPSELSGGMRKRASLVRTLAYDPPVILMDEPFGALDAQTRMQLHADLLRLWNLKRKTIVFVTHDIAEAIALGDRVLVLSRAPAKVIAEHRVEIPRPRDIDHLVAAPGFAALFERIRQALA